MFHCGGCPCLSLPAASLPHREYCGCPVVTTACHTCACARAQVCANPVCASFFFHPRAIEQGRAPTKQGGYRVKCLVCCHCHCCCQRLTRLPSLLPVRIWVILLWSRLCGAAQHQSARGWIKLVRNASTRMWLARVCPLASDAKKTTIHVA
jgi:hypothetical protein